MPAQTLLEGATRAPCPSVVRATLAAPLSASNSARQAAHSSRCCASASPVGASPTTIRIKAWADGTLEPTAWNYTGTNSDAVLQADLAGRLTGSRRLMDMGRTLMPLATASAAVAGVVLLLPGFMLTVAMSELATQNFLAGTGRLAGAFMLLHMLHQGAAHAWVPGALQMTCNFIERLVVISHGFKKITNLVRHRDQGIDRAAAHFSFLYLVSLL